MVQRRPLHGSLFESGSGNKEVRVACIAFGLLEEVLITVAGEDQRARSILDAPIGLRQGHFAVTVVNVMERQESGHIVSEAIISGGQSRRSGNEAERDLTAKLTFLGRSEARRAKACQYYEREYNQLFHVFYLHFPRRPCCAGLHWRYRRRVAIHVTRTDYFEGVLRIYWEARISSADWRAIRESGSFGPRVSSRCFAARLYASRA